jgi:class 3 adenylate cyclase/tetratricopeptide (TPR) repeat protein
VSQADQDALEARVAALEARVAELVDLVARLGDPADVEPAAGADDLWRRLGLVEGERRSVTVLFADVTGFTELSETLDPEAMQLVMRETMTLLAECILAQGGTLEKFIGDAVCAIFGAPLGHPDEPERAARAALAMHRALEARAAARPDLPPLNVHVGINTGPVIAGAVGDGSQFGVMGDTINTAARLMGLAKDAQTFVSASTARRLRRGFHLVDAGLHEVKGKAEPLSVASLLGELSEAERGDAPSLRAPLVGRDDELAALDRLATAAGAGDGVVALVLGDRGHGVSRLVTVLTDRLADAGWRALRASSRVHSETPLGLVASVLRPLVEDAGDSLDPQVADALLGGGVTAPHDFELGLADLLVSASREQPVVVTVEDVDDADPGSLEVLRYLTRATAAEAVLWVLAAEQLPVVFDPALGTDDAAVVRVGPLGDRDIEALFDAVFPGVLAPADRSRLAHLAEGNPQFALEIAHALVDDGVVAETAEGGWVLQGDIADVELPGSVAELIEARIDQLPTRARLTLQEAAVIGVRFGAELLCQVAAEPSAVDTALADLAAAELVVEPPAGSDRWSFRSRLVREVAYDSILRRRRPPAHRAVAEALLQLEPDRVEDNADLLAHHFEHGDEPALAMPHLVRAIDRAGAAYNFTGALDRARRAIRLRDRFPDRVDGHVTAFLFQHKGILQLVLGDEGGLADLKTAAELYESFGSPAEVVALHEQVGWYLTAAGRAEAGEHLAVAEEVANGSLEGPGRAAALAAVATSRALAAAAHGDLDGGLAAATAAVATSREAGDAFTETRALTVAGVCELWAGRHTEATAHLRQALDLAWSNVFGTLADRCGRWLVMALVELGEFTEAVEVAEPLLARADDRGDPSVGCGVRAGLANLWRQVGDFERARGLAAEAVRTAEERLVAADAAADAHLLLSRVFHEELGAGELGEEAAADAEAHFEAALAIADSSGGWLAWRWRCRVAVVRGRFALHDGNLDAVLEAVAEARRQLDGIPARMEALAVDRLEAQVLAARGDERAVGMLRDALAVAESTGSDFLVAEVAEEAASSIGSLDPTFAAEAAEREAAARARLRAWAAGTTFSHN